MSQLTRVGIKVSQDRDKGAIANPPFLLQQPRSSSLSFPLLPISSLMLPPTPPQTTLFLFCAGNEIFFVTLYLNHSYRQSLDLPSFLPPSLLSSLPPLALKLLASLTWPQLLGMVTFPVCATKQVINCVQFWKASKLLNESDQEERWERVNGPAGKGRGKEAKKTK